VSRRRQPQRAVVRSICFGLPSWPLQEERKNLLDSEKWAEPRPKRTNVRPIFRRWRVLCLGPSGVSPTMAFPLSQVSLRCYDESAGRLLPSRNLAGLLRRGGAPGHRIA